MAKHRKGPPTQGREPDAAQREMDWWDAVSAVASEIDALADAIGTLVPDQHPTVFVLIGVMLEEARVLRRLMRQKPGKKGAE